MYSSLLGPEFQKSSFDSAFSLSFSCVTKRIKQKEIAIEEKTTTLWSKHLHGASICMDMSPYFIVP
jgi:hypothetical protein